MAHTKPLGLKRFDHFLDQLQPILNTAAKQKNPALWLYRNDARTPLFMLEGLSKLYAYLHNKKKFTKLKEHFKLLEDALGAVDYYDNIAKDLALIKKMPAEVINYLQAQSREKIQSINEILVEKDWLMADSGRISKIKEKLKGADWMEEEKEVKAINEFYGSEIYKIIAFTKSTGYHFKNIESDVHELRRKLRWLSIYSQAAGGAIQLGKNKTTPKHLLKYCTEDIVTSPFNKMPAAGNTKYFLLLEQNYFYALSWIIANLGKIKDDGLHIVAVKEALQQADVISDEQALKKTYGLLGSNQSPMQLLLDKAAAICTIFLKSKIWNTL